MSYHFGACRGRAARASRRAQRDPAYHSGCDRSRRRPVADDPFFDQGLMRKVDLLAATGLSSMPERHHDRARSVDAGQRVRISDAEALPVTVGIALEAR